MNTPLDAPEKRSSRNYYHMYAALATLVMLISFMIFLVLEMVFGTLPDWIEYLLWTINFFSSFAALTFSVFSLTHHESETGKMILCLFASTIPVMIWLVVVHAYLEKLWQLTN